MKLATDVLRITRSSPMSMIYGSLVSPPWRSHAPANLVKTVHAETTPRRRLPRSDRLPATLMTRFTLHG